MSAPPEWAVVPHNDIQPGVEVRLNGDATIDEIVCRPEFFHLEQMDGNRYWIGLTMPGGGVQHIMLTADKGRIYPTVYR